VPLDLHLAPLAYLWEPLVAIWGSPKCIKVTESFFVFLFVKNILFVNSLLCHFIPLNLFYNAITIFNKTAHTTMMS